MFQNACRTFSMSGWYVKPFCTRLQNEELHRKYFDAQVGQANFKQVESKFMGWEKMGWDQMDVLIPGC